jgi:hypothetical protein
MVELIGDIGFLVFTAGATIFTLLYLTGSRWFKSFMGTLIAIFMICVVFLCDYLALRIWNINVPGVEMVRLVMFWTMGIAMFAAVIGFLEIQFGKRGAKLRARLSSRYTDVKNKDTVDKE